MKKIFLIIATALFAVVSINAQSLQDNEYYRKMVELKAQSEVAFNEGDYVEAKRLADEAQSYKELSDQWIANQLAAFRARSALTRVKNKLAEVDRPWMRQRYPEELAEGRALYEKASGEYNNKEYPLCMETCEEALAFLSAIGAGASKGDTLPAYYRVRLLPGNKDCLWNIAGYEFIYNDPFSWRLLYEANKDKMPRPNNPDLIYPDMILTIPSKEGESRSGTWENGEIH